MDTLDVTLVASADWGTLTLSDTVPASPLGTIVDVTHDFVGTPTTLHITGTVVDAGGQPVEGVTVEIASSALSSNSERETTSDDQGIYDVYAVVKAGETAGTLTYTLKVGETTVATGSGTFNAAPAALTDVNRDFTLP